MTKADRMFMVAVDVLDADYDGISLQEVLRSDPLFTAWWHHIPGCFLVSSAGSAEEITDKFMTVTGKARLLVVEANLVESEGCLPRRNWDCIRRREFQHAEPERT